jgi:integrase
MEAYLAAFNNRERQPIGISKVLPNSIRFLSITYYQSAGFLALESSSQQVRRLIIDRFCREATDGKSNGDRSAAGLQRAHIQRIIDTRASRPESANGLRKALRALMQHAVATGVRADDPTQGVKPIKNKSKGYHSWTEEEIAAYRATHPLGSSPRLALELLLGTAQRRSDMIRMGRQHVEASESWSYIRVTQDKTEVDLAIPILPELEEALAFVPQGQMTFLLTQHGKPYTPAGFGGWFRRQCNAAGLQNCSAHGLRKAASRRFAEYGFTDRQIMAWTGHRSHREVSRYTRAAEQKRLATDGAEIIAGTSTRKPAPRFAKSAKKS